jgi:hypothetical protein
MLAALEGRPVTPGVAELKVANAVRPGFGVTINETVGIKARSEDPSGALWRTFDDDIVRRRPIVNRDTEAVRHTR